MSPKGVLAGAGSVGLSLIIWAIGGLVVMIGEIQDFISPLYLKTPLFVYRFTYYLICPTLKIVHFAQFLVNFFNQLQSSVI